MDRLLNLLYKAANFVVYGNVFVAICSIVLAVFSLRMLQLDIEFSILAFLFSATLFAYNFQRRISLHNNNSTVRSMQDCWIVKNKSYSNLLTIASFLSCLYFLYILPRDSMLLIAPLSLISLLYVLQIGKQPALRSIPFLKVFIVAFVWGGAMILFPTLYYSNSIWMIFTYKNQLITLAIALFVFGQSLPFDIRDIQTDEMVSLKTIPSKLGIRKTILICWLSFFLSALTLFLAYKANFISGIILWSFLISILISSIIVFMTKKQRHHLFYGIILESCLLLPLLVYCVFSYLRQ